jgi:hypothetical protein
MLGHASKKPRIVEVMVVLEEKYVSSAVLLHEVSTKDISDVKWRIQPRRSPLLSAPYLARQDLGRLAKSK